MAKVTITYEVGDGYAGKARPQTFSVDSSEFEGQTVAEVIETLSALIGEDYVQRITWEADLEGQARAICKITAKA